MYISPNYSLRACLLTLSRVSNTHLHQEFYEDTGRMLTQKKNIKICLSIWIQSKLVCSTACIHFEELKLDENWKKVLFVWQSISQYLWAKCCTLFLNGLSVKKKRKETPPTQNTNKTKRDKTKITNENSIYRGFLQWKFCSTQPKFSNLPIIFWFLEPSSCLHTKGITNWQWDHPIFLVSSKSIFFLAQSMQD